MFKTNFSGHNKSWVGTSPRGYGPAPGGDRSTVLHAFRHERPTL